MAAIGKLSIQLSANTGDFSRKMRSARKTVASFGSSAARVATGLLKFASAAVAAAGALAAFVALRTIKFGVRLAAEFEQAQVAFTTMLGSADAARKILQNLTDFAASTPFQFPEIVDASRKLVAFGVAADDIIPTLRALGDVSAGIGAPIGEIAEIYGKARVQGRLFAEDINQLTGRGIPIIQELAKQFGVAENEVKKLVESGRVNFTHLERAFRDLSSEGGQFAGLMAAQSKTLTGFWSTMKDTFGLAAREIGDRLLPDLKELMTTVLSNSPQILAAAREIGDQVSVILKSIVDFVRNRDIGMDIINIAEAATQAINTIANSFDHARLAVLKFQAASLEAIATLMSASTGDEGQLSMTTRFEAEAEAFRQTATEIAGEVNELEKKLSDSSDNITAAFEKIRESLKAARHAAANPPGNLTNLFGADVLRSTEEFMKRVAERSGKKIKEEIVEPMKDVAKAAAEGVSSIIDAAVPKASPQLQLTGAESLRARSRFGFQAASLRLRTPEQDTADNTKSIAETNKELLRTANQFARDLREGYGVI